MPSMPTFLKAITRRAEGALDRPAPLGPDVDLGRFRTTAKRGKKKAGGSPSPTVRKAALAAGVDLAESNRSGTFLQVDHRVICRRVLKAYEGKMEVSSISEALARHRWLEDYWWKTVPVDADKYTAFGALHPTGGYFVRILAGEKISSPVQSCLLMEEQDLAQNVHNVVIAEEGSEAHLITGCAAHPKAGAGIHLGISEFYVKKGASLTFTMIHNWGEEFHVRPRSAAVVEEGGSFVSNFIVMKPVRSLQMYPTTLLKGKGARSRFQAILYGRGNSLLDIGSRTVLAGKGARSETVSRAIAADRSVIVARGQLVARSDECRAHLECRGMITSKEASLTAVPELDAKGVPRAELSHEAAISPIAEEEVAYLMSRGLGREEAVSTITRGFLNVDLLGLPPLLKKSVDGILSSTPPDRL